MKGWRQSKEPMSCCDLFSRQRAQPDILYLDWIKTLDQRGDYRIMVNGFLNSQEYRERFGH